MKTCQTFSGVFDTPRLDTLSFYLPQIVTIKKNIFVLISLYFSVSFLKLKVLQKNMGNYFKLA